MGNGIRGGKKPPHTIEITEIVGREEITQTIVLSKISTFTTWESESNGYIYKHTYWLRIELVSGNEYKFMTCDKNKFDEWVGILKAGVR